MSFKLLKVKKSVDTHAWLVVRLVMYPLCHLHDMATVRDQIWEVSEGSDNPKNIEPQSSKHNSDNEEMAAYQSLFHCRFASRG